MLNNSYKMKVKRCIDLFTLLPPHCVPSHLLIPPYNAGFNYYISSLFRPLYLIPRSRNPHPSLPAPIGIESLCFHFTVFVKFHVFFPTMLLL